MTLWSWIQSFSNSNIKKDRFYLNVQKTFTILDLIIREKIFLGTPIFMCQDPICLFFPLQSNDNQKKSFLKSKTESKNHKRLKKQGKRIKFSISKIVRVIKEIQTHVYGLPKSNTFSHFRCTLKRIKILYKNER